jgi:hypothetical protein
VQCRGGSIVNWNSTIAKLQTANWPLPPSPNRLRIPVFANPLSCDALRTAAWPSSRLVPRSGPSACPFTATNPLPLDRCCRTKVLSSKD